MKINRIVINNDGESVSYDRWRLAVENPYSISVIFVRNDNWCLAATPGLEWAAYNLWPDEWVGFYDKKTDYKKMHSLREFLL